MSSKSLCSNLFFGLSLKCVQLSHFLRHIVNHVRVASCGVVKRADGNEEVVVVGGIDGQVLDTVQIYSLEQSSWRSGRK